MGLAIIQQDGRLVVLNLHLVVKGLKIGFYRKKYPNSAVEKAKKRGTQKAFFVRDAENERKKF